MAVGEAVAAPPVGGRKASWRGDLQGIRAVAVLLVLIWHAGVSFLPGGFVGVDVFFVISGYLMTQILVRELKSSGTIKLWKFYGRRFRRLIPASTLVLAVTAIGTYFVLPETRWIDTGIDTAAAGLYVVNWALAGQSVDYLAQDYAPSPIQHYWSLSVEEQFYFFWPILLVIAGFCALRLGWSKDRTVFALLLAVFAVSLAWSIYLTSTDPGPAYFVTTTRAWELALGGIVAMGVGWWVRMPPWVALVAGWLGFTAIVATAIFLQPTVPFPGSVALIPTFGTAALLAAGLVTAKRSPAGFLAAPSMQWIGGISYALYLWHWPMLVIGGYLVTDGGLRELTAVEGLALVLASFLPAWITTRWVEPPFHTGRRFADSVRVSISLGAIGIAIAVVAGLGLVAAGKLAENDARAADSAIDTAQPYGAETIDSENWTSDGSISPAPLQARNDNPPVYGNGCHQSAESTKAVACSFGAPDGDETIALIGDSHAAHWVDALDEVALERGWKLLSLTKSSCPLADVTVLNRGVPAEKCREWNQKVLAELEVLRPSAVFLSNIDYQIAGAGDNRDAFVSGMERTWSAIAAMGIEVFILRDTPASSYDPPDCIAGHSDDFSECATPKNDAFRNRGEAQLEAAAAVPAAVVIDATQWVCPDDPCQPVIGGVMVYRDRTHMTATYSRSLGSVLNNLVPRIGGEK